MNFQSAIRLDTHFNSLAKPLHSLAIACRIFHRLFICPEKIIVYKSNLEEIGKTPP